MTPVERLKHLISLDNPPIPLYSGYRFIRYELYYEDLKYEFKSKIDQKKFIKGSHFICEPDFKNLIEKKLDLKFHESNFYDMQTHNYFMKNVIIIYYEDGSEILKVNLYLKVRDKDNK